MRHLVIIGFMGSGKSTLSSILASSLDLPIFSTDERIAQQMQMPIPKIFEIFGEDFFRLQEARIFKKMLWLDETHIVDCGGGFGAYQEVNQLGKVIFLDLEFGEILERMSKEEREKRPLFTSLSKAKELFVQRRAIYQKKAQIVLKRFDQNSLIEICKEMGINRGV